MNIVTHIADGTVVGFVFAFPVLPRGGFGRKAKRSIDVFCLDFDEWEKGDYHMDVRPLSTDLYSISFCRSNGDGYVTFLSAPEKNSVIIIRQKDFCSECGRSYLK